MRILVDIDGITADTMPVWLEEIARTTGVRATLEDIRQWDLCNCSPLDQLTPEQIFGPLQTPGFLRSVPLMPGAQEGLRRLMANGNQVYLVTARSGPVSMPETLIWLREKLPEFPVNRLVFCYDKQIIPADALIDDRGENLVQYHQRHPEARLVTISYRYNEGFESCCNRPIHRVSRDFGPWDAICHYLETP